MAITGLIEVPLWVRRGLNFAFYCSAFESSGFLMSDWERRLQEMGLLAMIVLAVLTVWIFVEWRKSQSKGLECMTLQPDGEQVILRGKQCAPDNLF